MSHKTPLISLQCAVYLARIINRVAASFDVAALSPKEAVELFTLLDRLTTTLWDAHKNVLLPLYEGILERHGLPVDEVLEMLEVLEVVKDEESEDEESEDEEPEDEVPEDEEPEGSGGEPR